MVNNNSGDIKYQGIVRWFDPDKGYGFADCDAIGEVFLHFTDIEMSGYKELDEGDLIEFHKRKTEKGFAGDSITIVQKAERTGGASVATEVVDTAVKLRFVVPVGSPERAADVIKKHYRDAGELELLIDRLLLAAS